MLKNICWANWLFTIMAAIFTVVSISSGLSGCGNKGNLYLPDSSSSTQSKIKNTEKKN